MILFEYTRKLEEKVEERVLMAQVLIQSSRSPIGSRDLVRSKRNRAPFASKANIIALRLFAFRRSQIEESTTFKKPHCNVWFYCTAESLLAWLCFQTESTE